MYRKDVLRAAGITMPAHPTWNQVAAVARKVDIPGMAGICLRGQPGWGVLGASFTTVLNTLGGTWWSAKPNGSVGKAMIDQPEFRKALQFYVDLVRDAGEPDAASASYNECLALYLSGKVAMWYDATVAAGLLEASNSPVRGRNGYAPAPVERTTASGWLWSWALAIPTTSSKTDLAWRYIAWATGPQYIEQAGPRIPGGWAAIPPGNATLNPLDSAVQAGRSRVRQADARGHRIRADRQSGYEQAPWQPGHPVRRDPPVPGCRQPVHRAIRRGDQWQGDDRLGARQLSERRFGGGRRSIGDPVLPRRSRSNRIGPRSWTLCGPDSSHR